MESGLSFDRIRRANRLYLLRYRYQAALMGVIEQVSRYDPQVNAAMKVKRQRDKNDKSDKRRTSEPETEPANETEQARTDTAEESTPPKSVPPPAGPRESNRPPPSSSIRADDDEPEFP